MKAWQFVPVSENLTIRMVIMKSYFMIAIFPTKDCLILSLKYKEFLRNLWNFVYKCGLYRRMGGGVEKNGCNDTLPGGWMLSSLGGGGGEWLSSMFGPCVFRDKFATD